MTDSSMQKVRDLLDTEDLQTVVQMGKEAITALIAFADSSDTDLAVKAVRAAVKINCVDSVKVLEVASKSRQPIVRITAANSAPTLGNSASHIVSYLLKSDDPSVRKWALRSAETMANDELKEAVNDIKRSDPVKRLKQAAKDVLDKWNVAE